MQYWRKYVLAVVVFLSAQTITRAQESMMQDVDYALLDKLIQTAQTNYPRIRMYGHKLKSAEYNIKRAKLAWFDIFNFSYVYSPNNSTTIVNPNLLNGYQLGLSINLGGILQKAPYVKMAKEEKEIAFEDYNEYMLSLKAQIKQRYFLYVQQLTMVRLRTRSATEAESSLRDSKYRYEKGETSLEEYNRNVLFMNDQITSKVTAEGAFLAAKASLEELLGKTLEEIN